MDWRLPLAALAVLSLLAGGMAVTSQVERDLEAEAGPRLFDDAAFRPPDPGRTQVDLDDFELPEDLDVQIPEGTQVSPDGQALKLDKPLTLDIPPGFPLHDLPFAIPEDFHLDLPPGSLVDADGLTLPRGARLTLPDGSTLTVPSGSRLDLPPEVMERLLAAGLQEGLQERPWSGSVENIPEGTEGRLALSAPASGGALTLPPGTILRLPEDAPFPLPPGTLERAFAWSLPAGTLLDWPALLDGARGFTSLPGFRGDMGAGMVRKGPCNGCVPVTTTITSTYPERVRKTEPFPVEGVVVNGLTGEGLAGAPIDVFLNASKDAPGHPAGRGVTDADGRFRVDARMPSALPAGDYQLVARSRAFASADGTRFDEGWSDPPIGFVAATTLTLDAPAVDGVGARVPLTGTLVDEAGAPVAEAPVVVLTDGARVGRVWTDADGHWEMGVTFRTKGAHTVAARFDGNENLEASAARADIEIVEFALDVPGTVATPRGGSVTLAGRVLSGGAGYGGAEVAVAAPFESRTVTSREDGAFSVRIDVPRDAAPGTHTVTYTLTDVGLEKSQTLLVRVPGTLKLDVPDRVAAGETVTARLQFHPSDGGAGLTNAPIMLTMTGPDGVDAQHVTAGVGDAAVEQLVHARAPGAYVFRVAPDAAWVDADPVVAEMRAGVLDVAWALPAYAVRGEPLTLAGRVTVDGKPLPARDVTVHFAESHTLRTDADGAFSVRTDVPKSMAPGKHHVRFALYAGPDAPAAVSDVTLLPVKIRPTLTIDAPARYTPGDTLEASVRLADDGGTTLDPAPVTVTVRSADGPVSDVTVGRQADGDADRLTVTAPAPTEGDVVLQAAFPGDARYTPATADATVKPEGTFTLMGLTGREVAVGSVGLLALAAAAVAGAWAWRRRRGPDAGAEGAPTPPPAPLARDIPVTFPDLEPDVPPVFGVQEDVRVRADRAVKWVLDGERVGEGAEAVLPFGASPGTARVIAEAADGARTEMDVRVVEYRREIAREFDALLDALGDVAPGLTRRATPREVEAVLLPLAPPRGVDALEDAVSVLEVTNYADVTVTRAHYVRFHRAAQDLAALLGPRATGPGGTRARSAGSDGEDPVAG